MFREITIDSKSMPALQASRGGPEGAAQGVVVFAHGSGSSRHSRRNRHVAGVLHDAGFSTLLLDLLIAEEEDVDLRTGEHRFDVEMLGGRVIGAVDWLRREETAPIGVFGASTGAAAALLAAARRPDEVSAVVSRGGRPDLAGEALPLVRAPTLLIVGGLDTTVIRMNTDARSMMRIETSLEIVPGATHLFEEPGALDVVADLAAAWFRRHLMRPA